MQKLKSLFGKIFPKIPTTKKKGMGFSQKIIAFFLVGFLSCGILAPVMAAAEDGAKEKANNSSDADKVPSQSVTNFGEIASLLVSAFTPFVAIQVWLAGEMMSNDFIFGNISENSSGQTEDGKQKIQVKDLLQKMWQVVRDLVNYAFIVVLLIIAFMTVIDAGGSIGGGDNSFIKSALPRLVVGLVAVNMTWFAGMVILDVATVTTHIVYGLPKDIPGLKTTIIESQQGCEDKKKCMKVLEEIKIKKDGAKTAANGDIADAVAPKGSAETADGKDTYTYSWGTIVFRKFDWGKDFNHNSIAALFVFGFLHVEELPRASDVSKAGGILDLAIGTIVSLIVIVIITVAMTALTFALLERVIIIWVNLILAPVGVLLWVIQGFAQGVSAGSLDEKGIGFGSFVKAAFLPAAIGAPLSIGFVLIAAAQAAPPQQTGKVDLTGLLPGVSTIYDAFWFVIAIGIMWQSVAIAEEGTKYVKGAISTMKSGVEKVVSFAVKAPLLLPWIPVKSANGSKESVSPMGVWGVADAAINRISYGATERAAKVLGVKKPGVDPDILRELRAIAPSKQGEIKHQVDRSIDFASALKNIEKENLATAYENADRKGKEQMIKVIYPDADASKITQILNRTATTPSNAAQNTIVNNIDIKSDPNFNSIDANSNAAAVAAAIKNARLENPDDDAIQKILEILKREKSLPEAILKDAVKNALNQP